MLEDNALGEAWALCFVANNFIGPMYRAIEADSGVTRPEFVVLLCVGQFEGLVAQDVANMSGLPRNTISRGVKQLMEKGRLRRAAVAAGNRQQVLALTDAGHALYAHLSGYPARQRARMLSAISERDRQALERVLRKLAIAAPRWSGGSAPASADKE